MPTPGPSALGRGVVVSEGDPLPAAWMDARVVEVGEDALVDPGAVVDALADAWSTREPVVVRLGVDPARFRAPVDHPVEPWTLEAGFLPELDRLQFLVWANTYDARGGRQPVWWWSRKAARLGATETPDGPADVALPDGTPAFVDGGPRTPLDPRSFGLGPDAAVVHRESIELGTLAPAPPPVAPSAELAPDQLAAVATPAGAVRVIAPAGSGKTRVLTERLRHLLADRSVEPELVLAVAYNVRARAELEARTAGLGARVQTLNGLAYEVLGRARGRRPRVLEEREVRRILDGLVPARARRSNTDPMAPYLEALTEVRLGLRSPEEVEAERGDVPGLADAYPRFLSAMRRDGAVDFDEQVYAAVEALLADGSFRADAQSRCRHLLVDEFQDLTPAHVLMLRLLSSPGLEVFAVGDDDQTIYSYSGADPAFLIDFAELFPGAVATPLEVNYRCPVPVVDGARNLLGYNRRRVQKEIRPGPAADADPGGLVVSRHRSEEGAAALVAVVERWLADGARPSEVAVLARVNSALLAPHVALVERGIPLASPIDQKLLDRIGVRAALAYLRIGADPDHLDRADVLEVLRRPSRGLPNWIEKWLKPSMSTDSLRAVSDRLDDAKVGDKIASLADDLDVVATAVATGTTRSALVEVRDTVGLGQAMSGLDQSKGGQDASALDDLEALLQVADLHPEAATFEAWLRSVLQRESDPDGVTLATVHKVKGLEWDRVVVAGVNEGLLPHRLAGDVEEERRVLHVAITRARRSAVVLADGLRPSPFLEELSGVAKRAAERPPDVVVLPKGKGPKGSRGPKPEPVKTEATEALRAWRLERARGDEVPAYVVMTNATLEALAAAKPTSLVALGRVPGFGPVRVERYGDEVLAVLDGLPSSS